jgi:hypothetical protein
MTIKLNLFRLKKMSNRNKIIIFLLLLPGINFFGQEFIQPLNYNPLLSGEKKDKQSRLKGAKIQSLSLPFFDDFSDSYIWPDNSKWIDANVYINSTYSDDPISIGVATFDALDSTGKLYTRAHDQGYFLADKLTSMPIDLSSYSANDSIFLSFFYQPTGLGEMPEKQDSFLLQFHTSGMKNWITVWSIPGDSLRPFKRKMVHIAEPMFLKNDFQFRFCNNVTINLLNITDGFNSNGDIWNLDYVQVDKKSKIDTLEDMAIIRPLRSPLKNFESIPWEHYKIQTTYQKEMPNYLYLYIRNNSNSARDALRTYIIKDIRKNNPFDPFESTTSRFDTNQVAYYADMLPDALVSSDLDDSASFLIKAFFNDSVAKDPKVNDTITYTQVFRNYYSYDDGSAEFGYGFRGEGTLFAMLAYKFETYKVDTLQAVNIFFNKSLDGNEKEFYLTVWSDKNGWPGDTLYKKLCVDNTSVVDTLHRNENGFNKFTTFYLDPPILVPKTFFVGWVQKGEIFLNVGLDKNRSPKNKTFYNIVGNYASWDTSTIEGALMIRPVLGKRSFAHTSIPVKASENIKIFPNPASDWIQIRLPDELNNQKIQVNIYDIAGNVLLNKTYDGHRINISGLQQGIYFIRIYSSQGVHLNCKFAKTCN